MLIYQIISLVFLCFLKCLQCNLIKCNKFYLLAQSSSTYTRLVSVRHIYKTVLLQSKNVNIIVKNQLPFLDWMTLAMRNKLNIIHYITGSKYDQSIQFLVF